MKSATKNKVILDYKDIDFTPPQSVADGATFGLQLRKQFNRGGTEIGIQMAKDLKSKKPVSPKTIARMYSYFARHLVDKQGKNFYNETKPSNGYIAWHLWGGDAGADWAYTTYKKMKAIKK